MDKDACLLWMDFWLCDQKCPVNIPGLLNVGASASDPVSLNLSIKCCTVSWSGTRHSRHSSINFRLISSIHSSPQQNRHSIKKNWPQVITPFSQHLCMFKHVTIHGTTGWRKTVVNVTVMCHKSCMPSRKSVNKDFWITAHIQHVFLQVPRDFWITLYIGIFKLYPGLPRVMTFLYTIFIVI
jgi:hypothetical protein